MKPNPVGWFEIYVQDMDRAKSFYESVFRVTLESLPPPPATDADSCDSGMEMWVFPMSEQDYGAPGALIRIEGVPTGAGGTIVYFSCEDCADEAARSAEHGGGIIHAKKPIGEYGFIAIVNDTEGNMIGLHSRQ
jgi:predicted enzyme related to lactoylglutathione lyase